MKQLLSISALATAAILAFAGSATAADMPVKAPPPPPPPPVYDWSGLYVGFHSGYLTGTVTDSVANGVFTADRDVNNWIAGFHAGYQREFPGLLGFGGVVLGVEGGLNAPLQNNQSNFGPCPLTNTSICGIQNFHDNWYAGGRLGLAWNWGGFGGGLGSWLFGGDYLLTVSGGWTTAVFQRNDVLLATGVTCAAAGLGSCTNGRHDGAYVGLGIDHVWAKGVLVDWVSGIDWQHQFFDDQTDVDVRGVGHTLSADVDIIRFRTTLKFKGF